MVSNEKQTFWCIDNLSGTHFENNMSVQIKSAVLALNQDSRVTIVFFSVSGGKQFLENHQPSMTVQTPSTNVGTCEKVFYL